MSHFPMKEQTFTHFSLFHFFSLYVLSFTMIFFLFNWLLLFLFFLRDLPLSEKKTQRGSPWHLSFFIFPYALLPHSSISLFLLKLLLPLCSTPFVDAQCSRALNHGSVLVGLPLSSSGFQILAFSPVESLAELQEGGQSKGRKPKDVARESVDLSYLNVNDPTLLHSSSYLLLSLVTQRQ